MAMTLTQDERVLAGFIEMGHLIPVETAAEWRSTRTKLQNVAGWFIDSGQGIKAVIALQEVKRLDERFQHRVGEAS